MQKKLLVIVIFVMLITSIDACEKCYQEIYRIAQDSEYMYKNLSINEGEFKECYDRGFMNGIQEAKRIYLENHPKTLYGPSLYND